MTNNEIVAAHKVTISASNAYRIMIGSTGILSAGAVSYIENMCRVEEGVFYKSPAMRWGIENEPHAIAALSGLFDVEIIDTGDNQRRHYFGDFVSALPDGLMELDGLLYTVEIKCLESANHLFAVANIFDSASLELKDWQKYCQIQCQMLCACVNQGILAYYDPRVDEEHQLHYVIVEADAGWQKLFLENVRAAHALYLKILSENKETDGRLTTTAPKNLAFTPAQIEQVLLSPEKFMEWVYDHFGVQVVDGHLTGAPLINCSTQKGRDAAKKLRNQITKARTNTVEITKSLVAEYKQKTKAEVAFRKQIESDLKSMAEYMCAPLFEWEAEQARSQREAKEEIERQAELAKQRELERVAIIHDKIKANRPNLIDADTLEKLQSELDRVTGIEIDELYQEFQGEAVMEKQASIASIERAIAAFYERERKHEDADHILMVEYEITEKLRLIGFHANHAAQIIAAAKKGELGALTINYGAVK